MQQLGVCWGWGDPNPAAYGMKLNKLAALTFFFCAVSTTSLPPPPDAILQGHYHCILGLVPPQDYHNWFNEIQNKPGNFTRMMSGAAKPFSSSVKTGGMILSHLKSDVVSWWSCVYIITLANTWQCIKDVVFVLFFLWLVDCISLQLARYYSYLKTKHKTTLSPNALTLCIM